MSFKKVENYQCYFKGKYSDDVIIEHLDILKILAQQVFRPSNQSK
jgi:hypothetical protein